MLESTGQKQISPNDKDALLVKGRDGKFAGYNRQAGVESKGHFIMHNEIKTEANDQQQLENCVAKAEKEMGEQIEEAVADRGYGNTTQILDIESKGPQCFVPLVTSSREKKKSKGLVFTYDKPSDTYICPQGNKLILYQKNFKHNGAVYNRYKCHGCEGALFEINARNPKQAGLINEMCVRKKLISTDKNWKPTIPKRELKKGSGWLSIRLVR